MWRCALLLTLVGAWISGCSDDDGAPRDASSRDASSLPDAQTRDAHAPDGGASDGSAAPDASPPDPPVVRAELIHSEPVGVSTPPTWNAHLPKLAGDAQFLYAVHTHYPQDVAGRVAHILRRPTPQPGGPWTVAATVSYPHQPPGIVMDTAGRLHLIFVCLRPGAVDVQCFQGGADTGGQSKRFYHLVFSARNPNGSLRFDTYANSNEWTLDTNGYLGLGTTPDGTTWWSLADSVWHRTVQYWQSGSSFGTPQTLSVDPYRHLYPIHAAHPTLGTAALILYAGEFDPAGGNNASYFASIAYTGTLATNGLTELIERSPAQPVVGQINGYPSDVAFAPDGTAFLLSYLAKPGPTCTELIRYDAGLVAPPSIIDVGCFGTYTKLQFKSDGTLYLLAASGGGAVAKLGRSDDNGTTWSFQDVAIEGLPSNGDVRYFGMTPVKPYTSPELYDPDRWVFFFSGTDSADLARHSYLGILELP